METRSYKSDLYTDLKLSALVADRNQTPGEIIRSLIKNAPLKDNKKFKRILEECKKQRVR